MGAIYCCSAPSVLTEIYMAGASVAAHPPAAEEKSLIDTGCPLRFLLLRLLRQALLEGLILLLLLRLILFKMLPILKNALVTRTCKKDFLIRKAELEWFTSNYWVIATQATVVGGFSFHQLSSPPPEDTATFSALLFVTLTTLSFILALYVIVRCTFSCILATGLALRGLRGFDSMNEAISYLRKQQDRILWCFLISLACFILSSFMMVYVFRRRRRLAIRVEVALHFVTSALAFMAVRATYLFYHESAARSGVDAIEKIFADVGDIDASVAPPNMTVSQGST